MFKKLREKVEGTDVPEKDGSSAMVKGRQRPDGLHKTDSKSFVPSLSETDVNSGRMTTEDLMSTVMQRTTQVKKLELKLADYVQALKECSREKDKLSVMLEKQQDSAIKHLSELEETYTEGKKKMEKRIFKLEKKEANLTETVETLRMEKQNLQESVDIWESEKNDFERKRDEFFAKRDNSEELNDLQMQEMAKLKHMLMMREKDCEKYRDEVDQKVAELLQCQDTNADLESSLRVAMNSLNTTEKKLEDQLKENEIIIIEMSTVTTEKKQLEEKVRSLTCDLKQAHNNLCALEVAYSDTSEKYESLKHSSEAVINKATVELGQKQGTVDHLSEKISLLAKRVATDNLPESEQVQALILERTSLENRLEESYVQLSNIKSTWSGNINKLEQQVFHLNAKIAEDREELSAKDEKINQLELLSAKAREEAEFLRKKLDEVNQELDESLEQNQSAFEQIAKLEAEITEQSVKHDMDRSKLAASFRELNAADQQKERKLEEEIGGLKKYQNESENHIKQLEKEVASLNCRNEEKAEELQDMQRSRDALRKDCDEFRVLNKLTEDKLKEELKRNGVNEEKLASSVSGLQDMTNRFENVTKELMEQSKSLEDTELRLKVTSSQLETVQQQLQETQKQLSECKIENETENMAMELKGKVSDLESLLLSREEELMNCKAEIASLTNTCTEDVDEVSRLNAERSKFTDQLIERERTIKVQQQRLNDLKKALSRELNQKSLGGYARSDNRTPSPGRGSQLNGYGSSLQFNTSEDSGMEDATTGTTFSMSDSDPNLTAVNTKYMKHVILTFLGGSQSEAQQLVKAMSMLLHFNKDEEKFVKEILEYRSSWFGSKPSAKAVQSLLKNRKR